jgi:hypothetical protein
MFATFHSPDNANFRASRQALLSGSGLSSVASFGFRASNGGVLSMRAQPSALFRLGSRRGFNSSCIFAGRRLTLRSSGTRRERRAPELPR